MLLNVRARLPSSKRYIEYLRNYSEYRVGFTGGARPKVVIIGTALRRHKTGSGVGVGTSFEALKRKFEVVPCQWTRKLPGGGGRWIRVHENLRRVPHCILASGGRSTVFMLEGDGCGPLDPAAWCPDARVEEVFITDAYS